MARNVRQIRRKGKQLGLVPTPVATAPSLDSRVALIQALIPVALEQVHAALQAEVVGLAGERYAREGRQPGHVRWTPQAGSIYLADQKIPIAVPRVRDRLRNQEVPLQTYTQLQQPRAVDAGLLHKVLGRPLDAGVRTVRRSGPRGVWAERLDGLAALHPRQCPQAARTAGPPAGGL